jgi:hypothetical protein
VAGSCGRFNETSGSIKREIIFLHQPLIEDSVQSQSQSHIATDGQSVSVLVSSPNMGHLTRDFFCFCFESYGLVFYCGALSDERSGLSCSVQRNSLFIIILRAIMTRTVLH